MTKLLKIIIIIIMHAACRKGKSHSVWAGLGRLGLSSPKNHLTLAEYRVTHQSTGHGKLRTAFMVGGGLGTRSSAQRFGDVQVSLGNRSTRAAELNI